MPLNLKYFSAVKKCMFVLRCHDASVSSRFVHAKEHADGISQPTYPSFQLDPIRQTSHVTAASHAHSNPSPHTHIAKLTNLPRSFIVSNIM
jgi:hypothetical protein